MSENVVFSLLKSDLGFLKIQELGFLINPIHFDPAEFQKDKLDVSFFKPQGILLTRRLRYSQLSSFKYFGVGTPVLSSEKPWARRLRLLPQPFIEIPAFSYHQFHTLQVHVVPLFDANFWQSALRLKKEKAYIFKSSGSTIYFAESLSDNDHYRQVASLYKIDLAIIAPRGLAQGLFARPLEPKVEDIAKLFRILLPQKVVLAWGGDSTLRKQVEEKLQNKIEFINAGSTFRF